MIKRTLGFVVTLFVAAGLTGVYGANGKKELSAIVMFSNPHASPALAVKNQDDSPAEWVMPLPSASALARRGIGNTGLNALHTGDEIKMKFRPARDGNPPRFLKTVITPAGRVIQISAGNPNDETKKGISMAVLQKILGTSIAIAVVLTVSAPSSAFAQEGGSAPAAPAQGGAGARGGAPGGGRGRGGPSYTPAPGAKDLKAVLFNWAWYMGMLRSSEERDLLMTLEYQGKGTVQVDGQPCTATKYRTSISYQTSGERVQYTGTLPNGQACSNVEVLSGAYTWNEDIPGAELVPGKGKATPMPAAVEERMIRLWAGPQGAFKAAMAGISDPPEMAPRPQRVPADVSKAGKTSVVWEGNKPVVTFPIPGVPNAIATATLDAKFMPERVVVKNGANTYEFTYSDYKDWNNPLNPAEAFYAGKMTERKNGTVLRDITTTLTETGQMYVVMPVPASVRAAIKPTNQPPNWTLNADAKPATQAEAVATPRLANGKPDFTGTWGFAPLPVGGSGARRCGPTQGKGAE